MTNSNIENINFEYFQADLDVLRALVDNNESLKDLDPLHVGVQQWNSMKLTGIDLSGLELTYLPQNICDIYSGLNIFDVSDNKICPPYPRCFEYISGQDTGSCGRSFCPNNYTNIDGECYQENHIAFLQALIKNNTVLQQD